MFSVMTYNWGVCIAIIVGIFTGKLVLAYPNQTLSRMLYASHDLESTESSAKQILNDHDESCESGTGTYCDQSINNETKDSSL
jgi:hypothetical protein